MLFNSLDFAIFLPLVFLLYWFVINKNLRLQNTLIVLVSYVFYGWWDWRFLSLIVFSSLIDFIIGIALSKQKKKSYRKGLLITSICVNLGLLGFFKYYNFFLDNLTDAFALFGYSIQTRGLEIVLPVGISFYTFQTLSYTIDVYKNKLQPTKDFIAFSAFVSFFPQLVAGPIERASNLLPQFVTKRTFDYSKAVDGLRQILWGLFKKIVIADSCAEYANIIFENPLHYGGSTLYLGAIFFAFQIYGDFSGYSDIAIGVSRLFGFDLMRNFAFPYFSRDIAEFWRRWHISLSTWFRDYLYIPLGGSKGGVKSKIRNTFIIFIVSGFWHGANWTFIGWGALNALYFLPLLLKNKNRHNLEIVGHNQDFPTLTEVLSIFFTFGLVVLSWIFFRLNSITDALFVINKIFSMSIFVIPEVRPSITLLILIIFVLLEWISRKREFALQDVFGIKNSIGRSFVYLLIFISLFVFSSSPQSFIYFQF
jgi:alginate O-acetyltransferase complex protein AlgI